MVGFSSNCIPNADRIQAALQWSNSKDKREQAVDHVKTQPIIVQMRVAGNRRFFTRKRGSSPPIGGLRSTLQSPASGLRNRLAWEIEVTNGPINKVYLDAISDEVIAHLDRRSIDFAT